MNESDNPYTPPETPGQEPSRPPLVSLRRTDRGRFYLELSVPAFLVLVVLCVLLGVAVFLYQLWAFRASD